ncbi:MAG: hypothetical protein R2764_03900 [Bacteroidales bacterium]
MEQCETHLPHMVHAPKRRSTISSTVVSSKALAPTNPGATFPVNVLYFR